MSSDGPSGIALARNGLDPSIEAYAHGVKDTRRNG